MSAPGLAVFRALRPPAELITSAALGTTYAADLTVCMAALCALDGAGVEQTNLDRGQAMRALERMRACTRIAFQQGRMPPPRQRSLGLGLLDRIVRPVSFAERRGSFHPKVWIVRQEAPMAQEERDPRDDAPRVRYVLVVGSRNLTMDTSWDYGVCLVGAPAQARKAPEGTVRLPRLSAFAAHVCALMGEPDFARERLPDLDRVAWRLPPGTDHADFDFHAGGPPAAGGHTRAARLFELPAEGDVLLLSPFLDRAMLRQAAEHWREANPLCLVAGGRDLDKVAQQDRALLDRLSPHVMEVADPDTGAPDPDDGAAAPRDGAPAEESAEEESEDTEVDPARGLHAKLALVTSGRAHALIVGSPNLSVRGWGGRNCEAFLLLRGTGKPGARALAEPLRRFFEEHAQMYRAPAEDEPPAAPDPRERLEAVRDRIAPLPFVLDEATARVRAALPWADIPAPIAVHARRYAAGKPQSWHDWPRGADHTTLEACPLAMRSAFVELCVRDPETDTSVAWAQHVTVEPPLEDARDRQALIQLLGFRGFLALLHSLIDEEGAGSAQTRAAPEAGRGRGHGPGLRSYDGPFLEDLLRHLARRPKGLSAMQDMLERYHADLQDSVHLDEHDRQRLEDLRRLLDILDRGMKG